MRLSFGLWTARRLTRTSVTEPRLEILSNAERLMGALNITAAVTVLESALVRVPTAMGWLKPVVLLPAQAMTGLSISQIDALIAHELAHIKRHDYLVNLLQSAIETLLFYHPAVWLISRRVRHERELCCDDLAIAACGDDRLTYASALADLESMRQTPEPMLAANGGSLLTRVKRILAPDDVQTVRGRGHWMAGVAILSVVLVLIAAQRVQGARTPDLLPLPSVEIPTAQPMAFGDWLKGSAAPFTPPPLAEEAPAIAEGADQKIAPGQLIHLEVTVVDASRKMTASELSAARIQARTAWVTAQDATARAKAEADRLAAMNFNDVNTVEETARTVPAFAKDDLVVSYLVQIQDKNKEKRRMRAENGYADQHPKMVAVDSDIASIRRQLKARLMSIVDTARLNYTAAKGSEDRLKADYDSLGQGQRNVVGTRRDAELSKDYVVQDDGTILVPYAGKVKAEALTPSTLQVAVRAALRAKGTQAMIVLASIEGRSSELSVFVVGDVTNPGVLRWRDGMTVADAISLAGGIKAGAILTEVRMAGPDGLAKTASFSAPVLAPAYISVTKKAEPAPEPPAERPVIPAPPAASNVPAPTFTVKVQGAVRSQGSVVMTAEHMNVSDALNAAGGLQPSASFQIRVRRSGSTDWEIFSRTDPAHVLRDIKLADGDTVDVPVAPKYFIQGFVTTPGEMQWEPNLTLERALLKAGGVTKDAAQNRIKVRRMDPATKQYKEIKLDKDKMNTIILANDIIEVPKRRM